MMDEIELQLCLSIDPIPSPHNTCDDRDKIESQISPRLPFQSQSQSLIQLSRRKRSLDCVLTRQTGVGVGRGTSEAGLPGLDNSLRDGIGCFDRSVPDSMGEGHNSERDHGCQHEFEPGHYLRLPARKRVRTSFSSLLPSPYSETKNHIQARSESAGDRKVISPVQKMDGLVSLAASLPEVPDQDRDPNIDHDSNTQPLSTDVPGEMDLDANDTDGDGHDTEASVVSTALMPPPPPSQIRETDVNNTIFHRPEPPPAYSVEPYLFFYDPVLYYRSAKEDGQNIQARRFSIYEDPDGMDIDGVGFFQNSWYISPEDDKENVEEEGGENQGRVSQSQSQSQHEDLHEHSHEHGSRRYTHDNAYHPSDGAEQEAYHPAAGIEQQAYYPDINATRSHPQPTTSVGRTVGDNPWASWSAQIPTYFPNTEPGSVNSFIHSRNMEIPTLAPTPSRSDLNEEHETSLPSPSSLSATDLSLQALSHQSQSPTSTSPSAIHTPNELGQNPHPRRLRRVIRSVNFA